WPRSLHVRAIEKLTAHGASVIAFDLMFSTPDPANDDALAAALRKAGCVVLLQGLERRIVGARSSIEIDEPINPIPNLAEPAPQGAGWRRSVLDVPWCGGSSDCSERRIAARCARHRTPLGGPSCYRARTAEVQYRRLDDWRHHQRDAKVARSASRQAGCSGPA